MCSYSVGALALEALHKQVLPFMLRRIKDDVLQDLPPKIVQDYYCNLSPIQVRTITFIVSISFHVYMYV